MNDFKLAEATEMRDFYQVKLEALEAKLYAKVGTYADILEHETLSIRIYELNLKINILLNKRKMSFWKKLFKK